MLSVESNIQEVYHSSIQKSLKESVDSLLFVDSYAAIGTHVQLHVLLRIYRDLAQELMNEIFKEEPSEGGLNVFGDISGYLWNIQFMGTLRFFTTSFLGDYT